MFRKWLSYLVLIIISFIGIPSYASGLEGGGDFVSFFLLVISVLTIIFLVFREVFCWYWKINERIALMKEIRDLLSSRSIKVVGISKTQATESSKPITTICPKCGKRNEGDLTGQYCEECGTQL